MSASFNEEEDFKSRLDWELWTKILRRALQEKAYLYPLAAVAILLAGIDAMFPLITRKAIDAVAKGTLESARDELIFCATAYAVLASALALCVWIFIWLAGRISTNLSHTVRRDCFERLQQLSFSYYDRRSVGWLMSRVTSDCSRLSDFLAWGLLDAVWGISLMTGVAIIMLWANWKLGLLVLATMPLLALVSWYFKKLILHSSRNIRKMNALITASYNEGIMGVRTSKTLAREGENLDDFQKLTSEMWESSLRNAIQSALYVPIILTLGSLATGLALWYGGVTALDGGLSLGTLIMFMTYATQFFDPVQQLAHVFTQSHRAQASGERIMDLLETESEVKDSAAVIEKMRANYGDGASLDGHSEKIENIEFKDVSFAYRDGPSVLKEFNLSVRSGQTIALVGPTGGGKSTIVSLVCRFYEPVHGQVLINGIDYRERSLHWLQSNLGMVLQAPHLFGGSVKENIRYGKLSASDDDVIAAARLVNAHDFIMAMEKGYDSPVGEGGNKLSTGQKQLLSFARAILADPQIFVMDEATSSVDTQTEQLIQRGLETILKGRISFIIAHRLSTIRSADRILVIENGVIAEQGTHHELIQQRGHYYELYTNQFVHEKEDEVLRES